RGNDVLLLAEHYISAFAGQLRRPISGISPEVANIFRRYKWPGNVRELRNCIERVMILEDADLITTKYLPRGLSPEFLQEETNKAEAESHVSGYLFKLPPKGICLEEVELSLVQQAIERSGGNQTRAAELLGISRDQLRYRLKKLEGVATEAS